ncbi:uncharacterized protein BDR25DRAFT_380815 [Lindgomyces ingoldianus]|uniref:Uncharacterized protein n=1 Tax=Lindgomyces ingoldianus TaxID=673940 RepID=A0ACB6QCD9_9PLEO|nr:uncharacterized protein BDR25DRAFT_380815 [Lindgomyces ingoldianus]KAF2464582.1 hypothetical protein BDR25DRAFT_380815 [Lindgomyces ingoldianus]
MRVLSHLIPLVSLFCTSTHSYPQGDVISPISADPFDYPSDFSWIQSYAAVGDSYAAGIGVGTVLGQPDAVQCSRYDGAYPQKMNSVIQAPNFQFIACSGHTSKDMIMNQIGQLQDNSYDLITVSAGGNDVGFSDVLKACLFLPTPMSKCTEALTNAEAFIDTSLERSIYDLLNGLAPKLRPAGFFVQTLYAKFFDETPGTCDKQSWCFLNPTVDGCLKVDVPMRSEFNRLVGKTNQKLFDTIKRWNSESSAKNVYAAHWGGWPIALDGQLCEPGSADRYSDPSNAGLAFIRPDVGNVFIPPERRELELMNITAQSVDDHSLQKRLPDVIMQYFHPTDWGTNMQAAVGLSAVSKGRAHMDAADRNQPHLCSVDPPPGGQDVVAPTPGQGVAAPSAGGGNDPSPTPGGVRVRRGRVGR